MNSVLLIISTERHIQEAQQFFNCCLQVDSEWSLDIVLLGSLVIPDQTKCLHSIFNKIRVLSLYEKTHKYNSIFLLKNIIEFISFRKTKYKILIFTNFMSHRQRWLMSLVKYNRSVSLTDGSVILYINSNRIKNIDLVRDNYKLFKPRRIKHILFFSKFHFNTSAHDSLITYSEKYLKNIISPVDEWHFIGSPLIELKKMSSVDLELIIDKLIMDSGSSIKYYMHPRESDQSLINIKRKCEVIPFEKTYEERIRNGMRPRVVLSFYSTVLFELLDVDSSDLKLIFIDIRDLLKKNDATEEYYSKIDTVYKYIHKQSEVNENVKCIPFHEFINCSL
jgi:hypothetical protein